MKAYWLSRKAAALKLAQDAATSETRLVHYDFAGHYSVKAAAASAERPAIEVADASASPEPGKYHA
jgi:hypothetical protein